MRPAEEDRPHLLVARRAMQELIHDPTRPPEVRQQARIAAIQAQRLLDRLNETEE